MTADWQNLPEGLYAIPDPHDSDTVSYWRRKDIKTRSGGTRSQFAAWPLKARNGPILLKRDVPKQLRGRERSEWVASWFADVRGLYEASVIAAILADPVAAGTRFAELTSRCCSCARTLTDDLSKCYGIGPECRSGISADVLARYYTPALGRAHAEHLANPGPTDTEREQGAA